MRRASGMVSSARAGLWWRMWGCPDTSTGIAREDVEMSRKPDTDGRGSSESIGKGRMVKVLRSPPGVLRPGERWSSSRGADPKDQALPGRSELRYLGSNFWRESRKPMGSRSTKELSWKRLMTRMVALVIWEVSQLVAGVTKDQFFNPSSEYSFNEVLATASS